MRISIAMATYNGEKYIKEQLESLAKQTTPPFELVVCDDGSTDNTVQIIRELSRELPFDVHLYENKENLQFTGNFFKAASICRGEVVAFCDQDDIWENRKIEICANALESEKADLVIHEGRVIDSVGRLTGLRIPDLSADSQYLNKVPFDRVSKGYAMVMRRQIIEDLMISWDWEEYISFKKLFGCPLGHDLFIYAWCCGRRKISFIHEELVRYRIHGANATASIEITRGYIAKFLAFFRGLTVNRSDYFLPAEKWAAEVEFLKKYIHRCSAEAPPGLLQLAEWRSRKSFLWVNRSAIYDVQSSRIERWSKLTLLLYSGAYISRHEPRLGVKSLIKDLLVVSMPRWRGIYK